MLKAVSKMLDYSGNIDAPQFSTQVKCGKYILDEIICSLEKSPPTDIIQVPITAVIENPKPVFKEKTTAGDQPKLEPKAYLEPPPTVEVSGEKEWMITVDEEKGLVIKDFPFDGIVELDGKKMKYGEARGQKFTKARIL